MTKDEIIKLIEDNGLTLHGDIEHFAALVAEHTYTKYLELPEAKQSGTISITMPAPIAYLCENATGHKYFRWKKPSSVYKPTPLYTTPPQPEQEPVEHAVIAGALFDFMGWLTSRKERIVLSSADEASPAVNAITDFAKMRGLSLNDAKVQDWNTTPPQRTDEEEYLSKAYRLANELRCHLAIAPAPQRTWVGLTDEDCKGMSAGDKVVAMWADRTLKEKNT